MRRRRWGDRLLAVAVGTLSLWYAVRWLDIPTFVIAVAQSLVPVAGILLVAVTLAAGASKRRRTAAVGVVASGRDQ